MVFMPTFLRFFTPSSVGYPLLIEVVIYFM